MTQDNSIPDKWARRIIRSVLFTEGFRGDNVRETANSVYVGTSDLGREGGPNTNWRPRQFRVKSEENDYVVCVPYDSQDEVAGEKEYKVAKPTTFRGGEERWGVYPPYVAESSVIWAAPVPRNGGEDSNGDPVRLLDLNFEGRSADGFWAEVGSSSANGTNKWTYEVTEQVPISGGFQDLTDGRSLSGVLNTVENSNSGSGIQGNSVDIDGTVFDDNSDLEVQPVQGSPVVWVRRYEISAGTYQYAFEYVNAIDGDCA